MRSLCLVSDVSEVSVVISNVSALHLKSLLQLQLLCPTAHNMQPACPVADRYPQSSFLFSQRIHLGLIRAVFPSVSHTPVLPQQKQSRFLFARFLQCDASVSELLLPANGSPALLHIRLPFPECLYFPVHFPDKSPFPAHNLSSSQSLHLHLLLRQNPVPLQLQAAPYPALYQDFSSPKLNPPLPTDVMLQYFFPRHLSKQESLPFPKPLPPLLQK